MQIKLDQPGWKSQWFGAQQMMQAERRSQREEWRRERLGRDEMANWLVSFYNAPACVVLERSHWGKLTAWLLIGWWSVRGNTSSQLRKYFHYHLIQ